MHRAFAILVFLISASSIIADSGPGVIAPRQEASAAPPDKVTAQPEPALSPARIPESADPGQKLGAPLPPGPATPGAPLPAGPATPGAAADLDFKTLDQLTTRLRAQREKLNAERSELAPDANSTCPTCSENIMKTRLRLVELLTKIEVQRKQASAKRQEPPKPPPDSAKEPVARKAFLKPDREVGKPSTQAVKAESASTKRQSDAPRSLLTPLDQPEMPQALHEKGQAPIADLGKPIDPMGLAQALFQTGDFEGALTTYRLLDLKNLGKTDRAAVQYFMATCLRRLGKLDEAAALYREVVNAKEDEILADCAQWQLSAFRWRHDLEMQLEQLQQRRRSVEAKP